LIKKETPTRFYTQTLTCGDTAKPLDYTPVVLRECDIQIQDENVYYGDKSDQDFELSAGDIVSYQTPVHIEDLYFKNRTAGSNATIVVVGII